MNGADKQSDVPDARDTSKDDAFDQARASWGFPAFARDFPRHPDLDALVVAFANGDYAFVRAHAPKLSATADDYAVKSAAELLEARTKPDSAAKILVLLALALLVYLTVFWVGHCGG
ncbi:MAG: hypothetical protein FWD73_10755 [Polyangiaceae bacterium]|nr:hypothetical protein [Polyangiaceae bacterium]